MSLYPKYLLTIADGGSPDEVMDLRDLNRGIAFTENSVKFDGTQMSGSLWISGPDASWMWTWYDRITNFLTHAERATGPTGHGSRVTVTVMRTPDALFYLDVESGTITPSLIYPSGQEMLCDVVLQCLPLIRDEPYSVPVTTFTNGNQGVYLEAVPGTMPALLGFDFTDVSTSGLVLNELMIGVWGERELASGGFSPVIDATAPAGGGAESMAAGFIGGTAARTVITNETWRAACTLTIPTRGQFEVWARIKDPAIANNSNPLSELAVSTTATGGALPVDVWAYILAALDASDNVVAISPLRTATTLTGTTNANHLGYVAVTGATKYRPYYKRGGNPWAYMPTTTSLTYNHTTETGATPSDPPTAPSPAVANTLYRLAVALPGGVSVYEYDAVPSQLANNQYEDILVADGIFPPKPRSEGESDTTTVCTGQNTSGGTNSVTASWDGAWLMPKGKLVARYVGLGLAALRRWVLTPDREGVVAGVLLDTGTGAGRGSLAVTGCPKAWPGNNLVVIKMRAAGGVSDVTDLKISGSVIVYPRRRWLGGVSWAA